MVPFSLLRGVAGFSASGLVLGRGAEELHAARHYLGALVLLLVAFPFARMQPSFNVNLAALLEIFRAGLGELPEHDHIVPFDAVLPFAGVIFETLVGGYAQVRNGLTVRQRPQFGIAAKKTDDGCTI